MNTDSLAVGVSYIFIIPKAIKAKLTLADVHFACLTTRESIFYWLIKF